MDIPQFTKIWNRALFYLSRRDYATHELRIKLSQKFPEDEDLVAEVIKKCEEKNFLDDHKFTQEYIRYRFETSPRGRFALRAELKKKGVAHEIIEEHVKNITEEKEFSSAKKVAIQKLETFSSRFDKTKKKEKLFRFLSSRGFSSTVIFSVLRNIIKS